VVSNDSVQEQTEIQKLQSDPRCLNCNEVLQGYFCHACGQKDIGERLNSRLMVHNLFESLTDLNSKPWHTLIGLVKNPGQVALAYINGARSSYINPIRFIITTFAIFIGFLAANGWLDVGATETIDIAEIATKDPDEVVLMAVIKKYIDEINNIVTYQRDLLTFIVVPIFALVVRWVFFKSGRNFAETLTLVCYVLGQVQLYAFLVALVPFVIDIEYKGTPGIILFIVFWQGMAGFYQKKRLKTFFMTIVFYLVFNFVDGLVAISLAALNVQFG